MFCSEVSDRYATEEENETEQEMFIEAICYEAIGGNDCRIC